MHTLSPRCLSTASLALALAGGPLGALAQSVDAPPSTPSGIAARAYTATSGGVRWNRSTDDRGVRGYEITKDGTVLGVRDTLSYVDTALTPGTAYRIGVTAIDTAGQRSGTVVATLRTPGTAPAAGNAPSPPAGLRANVYSATAGALAWTRPTVFGLRYEVRRGGAVVATTDGTSYVAGGLAPATAYAYEVIAIDRSGRRSAPARVTLTTRAAAGGAAAGPAAPTGLRANAYSATAGGVAWTRPTTSGLRYEVRRDGAVVATSDATSYVDTRLAGDRVYVYEVIAIDRSGRRSAPARVTLNTPPGGTTAGGPTPPAGGASAISAENRVALLRYVFDVFNGSADGYGRTIVGLPGYSNPRYAAGVPADLANTFDGDGPAETVTCGNGGTAAFTPYFSVYRDTTEGWTSAFADCQDDATVLDGTLRRLYSSLLVVESDGLSVDGPTRRTRYSGNLTWEFADSRAGDARSWNLEGVDVSLEEGGQSVFELSGADTILGASFPYSRYLRGGFTVRSAATGGGALRVRTLEPLQETLVLQDDVAEEFMVPRFDTGTLEITAADGSRLTLEAANGDPATTDVTVTVGGESETFTDAWTLWAKRLTCSFDRPLDPPPATEGCL